LADAVHHQILDLAHTATVAIGLTGIEDARIIKRNIPSIRGYRGTENGDADTIDSTAATNHLIILSSYLPETITAATNLRDDIGYPIQFNLIKRDNQDETTDPEPVQKWREQIISTFRNQHLSGVTGAHVFDCRLEPGSSIVPESWKQNFLESVFVLRFITRQARG